MKARKPLNAKKAAALAREGLWEKALTRLLELSDSGDGAAAASSAELLAALGRWRDFVAHAARFLENPAAVRAGNVFTDCTRLVRRAARELGDEAIITTLAAKIPLRWAPMRDATLLKELIVPSAAPGPADRPSFDAAVARAQADKRFKKEPPHVLEAHCWALAHGLKLEDEVISRYDAAWAWFDVTRDTARVLARRGEPEHAWALLEPKLPSWAALDSAQVFPVELLVDPWLSPLMTDSRCRQVLSTPRSEYGPSMGTN